MMLNAFEAALLVLIVFLLVGLLLLVLLSHGESDYR